MADSGLSITCDLLGIGPSFNKIARSAQVDNLLVRQQSINHNRAIRQPFGGVQKEIQFSLLL